MPRSQPSPWNGDRHILERKIQNFKNSKLHLLKTFWCHWSINSCNRRPNFFFVPCLLKSSLSLWQGEHCGQGLLSARWLIAWLRWGKSRDRDAEIDAWVSGLFNKATVWSRLRTSNTATSTPTQTEPTAHGPRFAGLTVTEKETEREGRDFKILQGPTKATALLHLLYIIQ